MMFAGICDICGKFSGSMHTCKLCGRRCCEECIDFQGICLMCRGGKFKKFSGENLIEI
ncbi:MAG: orotate phosphoribosyltransferase [Candidatus Altiarchaeum hamiconexum]|uniref:Orotate phosphoribosyltransferase n=1 Tax=Candidatus Altarchaeum hamiconexum TaxID=1803513 RepID=A0A8J7YZV7_9ARCH|nr:orotate phosphoribosyltransferase [Candidatus Altarchaeum hamiconexum]PIV28633.1 MAG: orotate phosphoribosyltransferase [Candidatus Altarchaeum sp. CG03_land_8_20_14_0_80_32_618]PJC13463.1 MAG: orotate phosphoribosyltransferase [Candidatus Altarchaeum sp. CG_4_9_14_0_8_um_filter_32_206]NCN68780.1 orotate phosphoribosyltransferase [Candidatus Altarchaeum hamiconexum]NCS92086.1 orotate phosphoribosyltransferase [Candidatus Altarchaeum hamiconexum]